MIKKIPETRAREINILNCHVIQNRYYKEGNENKERESLQMD